MFTHMLALIRNQHSALIYCNVTDACCFYEITSTQLTCITFYVDNGLK